MKTLAVLTTISELTALIHKYLLSLCFTLQMSLHIYPKQSRIPLLVHGSIISSLVVHGPGYPSRAYIRDHLEPTSGTISSQHLGPSRANIWDHLEPTSGTISSQHLGSSRANIWDHLEPTSGTIISSGGSGNMGYNNVLSPDRVAGQATEV